MPACCGSHIFGAACAVGPSPDHCILECDAVQSGRMYLCFGACAAPNFRLFYHDVGSCRPAFVHSCTPRRTDAQSYRDFDFLQAVNILVTPYILISGLCRGVHEICGLLGYYAALCGNCLPTFRDYHSTLRKIAERAQVLLHVLSSKG
jgi:hypothetical protein